jgi:ABC-2 type transport system ATP-binding protein
MREVGLPEKAFEQKVQEFSKGMRQKLGIAIAVIKDAPALLLDEPTAGLDPKAGAEFLEILIDLRTRKKAILMSTHDIFRVKDVADRVGIMKDGRKVMERTSEELKFENLERVYLDYMRGGIGPELEVQGHA